LLKSIKYRLIKKFVACVNKQSLKKQLSLMDTSKMLKAYCLKTKEKNVPMQDAVITKTAKGGYMAGGHDGKGNKMAAILSEAKALQAIEDGVAKKGF
jgi:hypothetical protein